MCTMLNDCLKLKRDTSSIIKIRHTKIYEYRTFASADTVIRYERPKDKYKNESVRGEVG